RALASLWGASITEGPLGPVLCGRQTTLQVAKPKVMLLVISTTTGVAIRSRLKSSDCTTRTSRRWPGSEPRGRPRAAHQIWPREAGGCGMRVYMPLRVRRGLREADVRPVADTCPGADDADRAATSFFGGTAR